MKQPEIESFPADIKRKLKTYVYRLIDPRNGETFYVGKGQGNRVFAHIRAEKNLEGDELDNKLKRIRDIRVAGFEVAHVIHRHGMDDKTAGRAFEPLFTTSARGTGLGLAIVRKIVEEHGGHVSLDSTQNRGTKVTLVIPAGT